MRILGFRDPHRPLFFDVLIHHLNAAPDIEVHSRSLLDPLPSDLSGFDLCVFWLLDPCDNRSDVWIRAQHAASKCADAGLPVFQHPDSLPNGRKSTFSRMMKRSGLPLRVARVFPIDDSIDEFLKDFYGLPFPIFVRENDLHSGELLRFDTPEQARDARQEIEKIRVPVVVEYIETAQGGLYHKFRYVVAGDHGIPLHLQITPNWVTRGEDRLYTDAAMEAERIYCSESPAQGGNVLVEATRVLGLDFCAYDYTFDHDGEMVVWEVNPAPMLHHIQRYYDLDGRKLDLEYRNVATGRALNALVQAYRDHARRD